MTTQQPISADFPFESRYVEVHGSNIHYVEEGSGDPVLFLHGQPTSSYLWRNVIPHVSPVARAIAMDNIGFGKSDKPDIEYRFVDHVKYVEGFIEELGLKNVTLVIHDWGSALGFHYVRNQSNVKGIAFMEALLMPIPSLDSMPGEMKEIFTAFRTPEVGWDMIVNQNMFIEQLVPQMVVRKLTDTEMDAIREPFTDPSTRLPLWRWPNEIPIGGEPADVHEIISAYAAKLPESNLPKLLFYADPGAIITPPVVEMIKQSYEPLKTVDIGQGIHYVQDGQQPTSHWQIVRSPPGTRLHV